MDPWSLLLFSLLAKFIYESYTCRAMSAMIEAKIQVGYQDSFWSTMISAMRRITIALLLLTLSVQTSGQYKEWCIADEQTPDDELQRALDWACGKGGADCRMIQNSQPCFLPDTVRGHASYAFNNYYQKFKHNGATCYFNSAAITTDLDPSHGSCKFEFLP